MSWLSGCCFVFVRPWLTRRHFIFVCRPLFFMPLVWYFKIPVLGHHHTSMKYRSLSLWLLIFMCFHVLHHFSNFWGENLVCDNDTFISSLYIVCSLTIYFMNLLSATLCLSCYHFYPKICVMTGSLQLSFNFSQILEFFVLVKWSQLLSALVKFRK